MAQCLQSIQLSFTSVLGSTSAGLLGYGNGVVGKVCGSVSVLVKYAHATNVKHVRCFAVTDALGLLWHNYFVTT